MLDALPALRDKLKSGKELTVVALGDSITTYFGNHSRNRHYYRVPLTVSYYSNFMNYLKLEFPKAKFKIINRGIGGETAVRGLKRVEKSVLSLKPDLVFVMYGANDGRAGYDINEYLGNLRDIVTKVKATGAEVILVAPTMSLVDLTWLLPYRAGVLSLASELDTPVLDGTLALWPVDENVDSIAQVHNYLARHFPPNGDDIHPWVPGQFQMGRRLWEQFRGKDTKPQIALSVSPASVLKKDGSLHMVLEVKNKSKKAYKGKLELLLPYKVKVLSGKLITEELANTATGNRLVFPARELELAAVKSAQVEWNIRLPLATVIDEKDSVEWLTRKPVAAVAEFNDNYNTLHYLELNAFDADISVSGPDYVFGRKSIPITFNLGNSGPETVEADIAYKKSKPEIVTLAPGQKEMIRASYPLPGAVDKLVTFRQLISFVNSQGSIRGMYASLVEASPCVDALEGAVRVDADLADWKGAVWYSFAAGKAEASFSVKHDDKYLYMAFKVKDDVLEFGNRNVWANDGFELYIANYPKAPHGNHDKIFQLGFFPPKDGVGELRIRAPHREITKRVKSMLKSWRKTADGYQIEVAIPAVAFSKMPLKNGQLLGFGVACNDVAVTGRKRTQYQWVGDNNNYASVRKYGLLRWGKGEPAWRIIYE